MTRWQTDKNSSQQFIHKRTIHSSDPVYLPRDSRPQAEFLKNYGWLEKNHLIFGLAELSR